MEREHFLTLVSTHQKELEQIKNDACQLHASVNQTYDGNKPYGFHLSMVADAVLRFGHLVVANEEDLLPVFFAAYYHDSIEDARLAYNDVTKIAKKTLTDEQAFTAAEIVYALTNDKGRTRAERAGERYYAGIRTTPYAPFLKLCDRWANMTYSFKGTNDANNHMHEVYQKEWPHFLAAITSTNDDPRLALPKEMTEEIERLFN